MEAQSVFFELRSIPRSFVLDFTNDYAKKQYGIVRKRWFADFESGYEFSKNYFSGFHISYNKSFFDYPSYYYLTHSLADFWQQSFTSGIFLKRKISFGKKSENKNNSLLIGAYLFYSQSEMHQLIDIGVCPYGVYEIPINIKERKFSYAFQISSWIKLYKKIFFEPAIQIGYFKKNPEIREGEYYISGHGYFLNNNGVSENFTISIIYMIKYSPQ